MKRDIYYLLNYLIIIVFFTTVLVFFYNILYDKTTPADYTLEKIINECSNQTLIESTYCVRDITKTFFKYNMSNIERDIDFETLKREGGMCESWTDYWCEIGDRLDYYTRKVAIDTGFRNFTYGGIYGEWLTDHSFCVWSDEDSYVVIDGIQIQKTKFDNSFFEELK